MHVAEVKDTGLWICRRGRLYTDTGVDLVTLDFTQ